MENFEKILGSIKSTKLTDSERASMRNSIQLYMHEHPVQAPFGIRVTEYAQSVLSVFEFSARTRFVQAALALVLIIGVGTSYAAENALPGDPLYAMKIYFNENVQGTLAVSQSAKADWNTELMTRRLEEAETLASENKLTPVVRSDIQAQLLKSANNFDQNIAALAKTQDTTAVATAQSNLEASLEGHVQVLAALTADVPQAQAQAAPLIATVSAQVNDAKVARASAETNIDNTDTPAVKTAAIATKADATLQINAVRAKVAAATTVDATGTAQVARKSAFKAEQAISSGDDKLNSGEYGKAFSIFQAAIRAAKSAQVNLDAAARLKTDLAATSTPPVNTDTDVQPSADTHSESQTEIH